MYPTARWCSPRCGLMSQREHMFSAVHPITDITKLERHVRKVLPNSCTAASSLFDHLVGTAEQRRRHFDAERLGRFQIDYQFELDRPDHR